MIRRRRATSRATAPRSSSQFPRWPTSTRSRRVRRVPRSSRHVTTRSTDRRSCTCASQEAPSSALPRSRAEAMTMRHRQGRARSSKSSDYRLVERLESIPNIGPSLAADLRSIGIAHPHDLPGEDPYALYERLCRITASRDDPCVLDTFIAAVRFMEGAPAHPWWHYTAERKAHLQIPRFARDDEEGGVTVASGQSPTFRATSPRPRPGSSRRRGG